MQSLVGCDLTTQSEPQLPIRRSRHGFKWVPGLYRAELEGAETRKPAPEFLGDLFEALRLQGRCQRYLVGLNDIRHSKLMLKTVLVQLE